MSVYFRCTVQNEAIDFINIWQTSTTLNEVFERLEDSKIWAGRVARLGNRQVCWYSGTLARYKRSGVDMSTRGVAYRFYNQLKNKGISLKSWCDMPYHCEGDVIDLNAYAAMVKSSADALRTGC